LKIKFQTRNFEMTSINNKLFQACSKDNLDTIKTLIKNKADISAEDNQAVRWASFGGHLEVVKFLVENKADISARDNYAVRMASRFGHLGVVKFLVENKADISARDNYTVKWASCNGYFEVVKFLLSNGADLNKVEDNMKIKLIQDRYYRRWRLFHWKKWFTTKITPIYYSPGFTGAEKEKSLIENIIQA